MSSPGKDVGCLGPTISRVSAESLRIGLDLDDRLDEDHLENLEYVDQWELITIDDESSIYVIGFTGPTLPDELIKHAEDLIGACDPKIGERGVTKTFLGSKESIRGTGREYGECWTLARRAETRF